MNKLAKETSSDRFKLRRVVEEAKSKLRWNEDLTTREAVTEVIQELESGVDSSEFSNYETREEMENTSLKVEIPIDIEHYALEIIEEHSS